MGFERHFIGLMPFNPPSFDEQLILNKQRKILIINTL